MPSLVAFGRRWRIGSDDLTFPAFTEFMIRLLWLVIVLVLYLRNGSLIGCSGRLLLEFLISMITIQLMILIILPCIMITSMRGTITNVHPRRHISKFLYFRLFLFILEFFCYIIGILCISDPGFQCKSRTIVWLMYSIVIILWLLFIGIAVFVAVVFNPLGNVEDGYTMTKSIKTWERQIRLICCCCFCGFNKDEQSQNAFKDISELMTAFIKDVDLVPSDVAAGLILLASNRKARKMSNVSITQQPNSSDAHQPWMTVPMANAFIRFAVGSYGWPMYMFDHFWTGLCHLWPKLRCFSCRNYNTIIDDNCCMCHMAALKIITKTKGQDFLYVSFYNRVFETPFYIVADHNTGSIVISIRGTISQRDVLTDLSADSEIVEWVESSDTLCVHRGIYSAAQSVYQKIMNLHLLDEAFAVYSNYNLVVTGHSLGAGTASILAFLLRPHYPDLRCYAFSPPGCLFNEALHKLSTDLIMSVVVGDDLVISLTWNNMEEFKSNLVEAINQSVKPKYQILVGGCWQAFCGYAKEQIPNTVDEVDAIATTPKAPLLRDQVGRVTSYSSRGEQTPGSLQEESMFKMLRFPPGSILHITKYKDDYVSSWADPSSFSHFTVSSTMGSDHMPNYVQDVLSQMVKSSSGQVIDI